MATSNLDAIRVLVRQLTRCPSETQLTTTEIDQLVNTFILNDFPAHLQMFSLRTTFTFYCNPYQDTYLTDDTIDPDNPLYNFINRYTSVQPPLYIAGYQSYYSESPAEFYGMYPLTNAIASIGAQGNGVTTTYSGTLSNIPVLAGNVLFSSVDINNNGLALVDVQSAPPSSDEGVLVIPGTSTVQGVINYVTGAFSFTFPTAPASGQAINSQTIPYTPSLPQAMLYYDNKFVLRPVPDQPYTINFEVYANPTELLSGSQNPKINQWYEYIAYGAAIKVLQRRNDPEGVAVLMPEFKNQQSLVLRRSVMQYSNQRAPTIYSQQTNNNGYNNAFGWGWGPF